MENIKTSFPSHGWIGCSRCMPDSDQQLFLGSNNPPEWKIEKPNASWGAIKPLVVVLGFSRGTNQKTTLPFDEIAFAGMRPQLSKILQKLRLLEESDFVGKHINARETKFHFGSLFRCSVSMWDKEKEAALDTMAYNKYPTLTEAEIKTLVVEDKWLTAISAAIHGKMDRISQGLTQRVKELAERYESLLPLLTESVAKLSAKVDAHLQKMGFMV